MIALRCPVCGNLVDAAIDGGCTKRCDDIFHGKEELMTPDPKAPLPEGVNLKTAMRGITDYLGYEGSADICRAHIAALEAEIELQKDLRQRAQDITDRSLARTHHYERLAAKSAANVYVLQKENKRLREALDKIRKSGFVSYDGPNPHVIAADALAPEDGKAGE